MQADFHLIDLLGTDHYESEDGVGGSWQEGLSCSIKVHLFCEEMHILQPTGPLPSAFTFLLNGLFPLFTSLDESQR